MTYRVDPSTRKAAAWHKLLNNGFHFVLRHPTTGKVIEKARHKWELTHAHRLQPFLELVFVDDQI